MTIPTGSKSAPSCFFLALTNCSLEALAYLSIKVPYERSFAAEILMMHESTQTDTVRNVFAERTEHRALDIVKNDRQGLEFRLLIKKKTGFVCLCIQKKRAASVTVVFMDTNRDTIHPIFRYKSDCNSSWVKCILYEFEPFICEYVRNGFSNRIRDLKRLIRACYSDLCTSMISVNIDIPGYICLIDSI